MRHEGRLARKILAETHVHKVGTRLRLSELCPPPALIVASQLSIGFSRVGGVTMMTALVDSASVARAHHPWSDFRPARLQASARRVPEFTGTTLLQTVRMRKLPR